jgi:hypothetical protein
LIGLAHEFIRLIVGLLADPVRQGLCSAASDLVGRAGQHLVGAAVALGAHTVREPSGSRADGICALLGFRDDAVRPRLRRAPGFRSGRVDSLACLTDLTLDSAFRRLLRLLAHGCSEFTQCDIE